MSYPVGLSLPYIAVPSTPGYSAADHSVSWSFDDATTASGTSTGKAWATPGPHTATASATNKITGGRGSTTCTVIINNPQANLATSLAESKAFYANGSVFTALGDIGGNYEYNKFSPNGPTASYYTPSYTDSSRQTAINSPECSAALSADGAWIVACAQLGATVPTTLIAINTATGVMKSFNFRSAININYAYPLVTALIVARPDNKFAVSIMNQSWNVPYTFIYDPVTNTHSNVVMGSYAYVGGITAHADDGYVYCLQKNWGGNTIIKYNVNSHSWATATLPSTQYDGSTRTSPCVIKMNDGKFLLIGGWDSTTGNPASKKVAIFDPAALTITDKSDMNTARYWPACALLPDGRILAAGGRSAYGGGGISSAEIYDPLTNTWTTLSSTMSQPRGCAAICALPSGNFAIIGGYNGSSSPTSTIEYYHPVDGNFYSVD